MTLTTIQWISLAIFISGIILFLFFVFRKHDFRKKVVEEVEEYKEEVKEFVPELKASKRKKKEEEDEDDYDFSSGSFNITQVAVTIVIFAVVFSFGMSILNDVSSSLNVGSASYNSSYDTTAALDSLNTVSTMLPVLGAFMVGAILLGVLFRMRM